MAFLADREFECSRCGRRFTRTTVDLILPEDLICDDCLAEMALPPRDIPAPPGPDAPPLPGSYDYSRRAGIRPISWEDFHGLCQALALAASGFRPEVVLAVARGGLYPGALIAHMLQVEIYAVRLSRRVDDVVRYKRPRWIVEPSATVAGRRVLIVDEISSTGETLGMVKDRTLAQGAAKVRTAVLYAHTWGTAEPDYVGLISDELLLNPWDREVVRDGRLEFHPEYVAALAEQGLAPDPSLRIPATPVKLAKG